MKEKMKEKMKKTKHEKPRRRNGRKRYRRPLQLSERERDFIEECERVRENTKKDQSIRDTVKTALTREAPGYYLSYDYAMRIVNRNVDSERRGSKARQRNAELRSRVESLERRLSLSRGSALSLVLESHASSYFMSQQTAEKLFYRYLNQKPKKKEKRNDRHINR